MWWSHREILFFHFSLDVSSSSIHSELVVQIVFFFLVLVVNVLGYSPFFVRQKIFSGFTCFFLFRLFFERVLDNLFGIDLRCFG
jgi:hypothetical protein